MLFYGDTTPLGACARLGVPGTNLCVFTGYAELAGEKKPALA